MVRKFSHRSSIDSRSFLVPSIAKEYVSNRKKHDNTARQWTQLYAHPQHSQCPPLAKTPLPSPGPSRVGARSRRRQLPPVPSPQPTTSSSEPITIDDSDNEHSTIRRARPNRTTGNKRKRDASGSDALAINGDTSAGPSRTRRQRNIGNDVVDVDGVIVIDDD